MAASFRDLPMPAKYFHPNTLLKKKKKSAPLLKSDVGEMFAVERIVDKRMKVGVQGAQGELYNRGNAFVDIKVKSSGCQQLQGDHSARRYTYVIILLLGPESSVCRSIINCKTKPIPRLSAPPCTYPNAQQYRQVPKMLSGTSILTLLQH